MTGMGEGGEYFNLTGGLAVTAGFFLLFIYFIIWSSSY